MPRFDRLNQWANFLDDVPSDRFHMPMWSSSDGSLTSCGTAGCAAGWAVNRFHREGLHFTCPGSGPRMEGVGGGGVTVIAKFFDIPRYDAETITCDFDKYWEMFDEVHAADITPHMAAEMIRHTIRKLGGTVTEDYPILPKTALAAVGKE